jgi:hypothetical protein
MEISFFDFLWQATTYFLSCVGIFSIVVWIGQETHKLYVLFRRTEECERKIERLQESINSLESKIHDLRFNKNR